jgi:hypothetical protein
MLSENGISVFNDIFKEKIAGARINSMIKDLLIKKFLALTTVQNRYGNINAVAKRT